MKTILNFLKSYGLTLVLVFSIGTQIVNCNGAATDDIADLITPPPGGGGGGGGGGSTGGDTVYGDKDNDFYIGVVSATNGVTHVRTVGAFGTKCKISKDATTSEDLTCIIDSPEGSLFYNGLEMSYNVPQGMCQYLVSETYWFYNEHSGVGPGNVVLSATTIEDTNTATSEVTTTYSYSCTTGNRIGTSVTDVGCSSTSLVELDIKTVSGTFTSNRCVYDRTNVTGGKNCCFGSYRKRVLNFAETRIDGVTVSTTSTASTTTTASWGGDYKNCIGGPAKTNWEHFIGDNNFPASRIDTIPNGVFSSYKISPILDKVKIEDTSSLSTSHISNMFNSVSQTHTPAVSGTSSAFPYAIKPADDLTGSQFDTPFVDSSGIQNNRAGQGNDAYSFICLDAAYEAKHRIRVYVREWDTYTDYLAYISSAGVTIAPDNKGTSPLVNCEGLPGPCNDFTDIDDLANSTGSYTPTVSATVRETYFPRIKYKN